MDGPLTSETEIVSTGRLAAAFGAEKGMLCPTMRGYEDTVRERTGDMLRQIK